MLPRTEAATTYLTGQAAASTYALKTSLTELLSEAEAAATYVTQDAAAMTYLTTADAATTYALAEQAVAPDALTTALADYHRKDQAMVVTHATTFKAGLVLEGEQTDDPDLPEQNPVDSRRIVPANGQMILVPEQGDISMGEFRAGALPVAAPVP